MLLRRVLSAQQYEVLYEMNFVVEDKKQGVFVNDNMNRISEDEATQAAEGQGMATIAQHVEDPEADEKVHVQLSCDNSRKSTHVLCKVLERAIDVGHGFMEPQVDDVG